MYLSAIGQNLKWYLSIEDTIPLISTPQAQFNTISQFQYYVTQTIGNCEGDKSVMFITVEDLPAYNFIVPNEICIGSVIDIGEFSPGNKYLWENGDTLVPRQFSNNGFFTLTISNHCGPSNYSYNLVFEDCESTLYIPNSFSPNQDGVNDTWSVVSTHVEIIELSIFNRFGALISTSSHCASWDGEYLGKASPAGCYSYLLKYKDSTGLVKQKCGAVLLIK
jgi:gliding motility-associated-like protein